MLDKLLLQYADHFHENFPVFLIKGMQENEIMKIIRKCLDENKPYNPDIEPDEYY